MSRLLNLLLIFGFVLKLQLPALSQSEPILYYDFNAPPQEFPLEEPNPDTTTPETPSYPSQVTSPAPSSTVSLSTRLEIELSRRRLIVYQGTTQVKTYAVAVGRQGWRTPVGQFEVMQMIRNPAWTNPFTGEVVDGGESGNPLGAYWIGFWTDGHNWVGMHGTPNPESVGRAASHGCIRLYNRDIQELFMLINVGTPVTVMP